MRRPSGESMNFNPRSSCEERRLHLSLSLQKYLHFNPRSSCEERLFLGNEGLSIVEFQSTLLMRGATSRYACERRLTPFQSTLLMRGATISCFFFWMSPLFQSTLLMRGATPPPADAGTAGYFNPRSSCEERPPKRCARPRH